MKNLLNHIKEEWYKYVLEIIVIVGSILGAFGLESWDEDMKLRNNEKQILIELKTELENNKIYLDTALNFHKTSHDHCLSILNIFNEGPTGYSNNEIDSLLSHIGIQRTFDSRHGYLKSIISSGQINYLQNHELITLISQYEDHVEDAIEFILPINSFFLSQMLPELSMYYSRSSPHRLKRGFWSLIPLSTLESYLAQWSVILRHTYEEEKVLLSTIEEMISLIEKELE
jgi:hypothetical protein